MSITAGAMPDIQSEIKLFSGRANIPLAEEVASYLGTELGKVRIKPFSDGELYVQILESVRRDDVYLIQPTCQPVNENFMELLLLIDALKRASAETVTVVIPYFGYSRQDRKSAGREPIAAKLFADMLTKAGVDRVVCVDLHAAQVMGFFDTLVDHLYASSVLIDYIKQLELNNITVVSPDIGGVARARAFARLIGVDIPLAIIDKRRSLTEHNSVEVLNLIGNVKDQNCILVDDIIDTAGTMTKAATMLKQNGANNIFACATHAVLSGKGIDNINESVIKEVIITNTIPLKDNARACSKIKQLSVAPMLGEVIQRIHKGETVSEMFTV